VDYCHAEVLGASDVNGDCVHFPEGGWKVFPTGSCLCFDVKVVNDQYESDTVVAMLEEAWHYSRLCVPVDGEVW
jgi:hypothetical protein